MRKTKFAGIAMLVGIASLWLAAMCASAQAPAAPASGASGVGQLADESGKAVAAERAPQSWGLFAVIGGSGVMGVLLWIGLFGSGGIAVYLMVDCYILIQERRIMSPALVSNVTQAMGEGDVVKALQNCEDDPGPLANILTAGFSHVEEGFDVIQEAIRTAADLEAERMMQRVNWISVMSNVSPMLGLLGTVQGMIWAFAEISKGSVDVGYLAMAIGQALYTTAVGLIISVPSVGGFFFFRNMANKIVLRMEALTMELIKDLRNVEVVQE
ncbi:MAG: MotA/TolQ/ExbB proton channel family protein [Verrucomicrobiota bacterium]|nr:MotA/TolQ/ExbB proton channel family protein [Verrucomicrobiota bacterium]